MSPLQATHQQVRDTMKWYLKHKQPFTFEVQNESLTILSGAGSYTTRRSDYTIPEINFIKEVKRYIIKNTLPIALLLKPENENKTLYFKYNPLLKSGQQITNCVNIDINGAYWATAYNLGLISKEMFNRGLTMRKEVRLASIGSLAKKKMIYSYDGKTQKREEPIRSEETEFIWDIICSHVGNVMMNIAQTLKNDFIFFWVDGIYVKKGCENIVKKQFKINGYDCKVKKLKHIDVTNRNLFVHLVTPEIDKEGKEKKYKPFPFRTKNISTEFLGYNTDL